MAASASKPPPALGAEQRGKHLSLEVDGPPLPAIRTRSPSLARARFNGARILDRLMRERGVPNTDLAAAYDIDEKDVRAWRKAGIKFGFGEAIDLPDAFAEQLLLAALDHVRARRRARAAGHEPEDAPPSSGRLLRVVRSARIASDAVPALSPREVPCV